MPRLESTSAQAVPKSRLGSLSLQFRLGEFRLLTRRIPAEELYGTYPVEPLRLDSVKLALNSTTWEQPILLARSVVTEGATMGLLSPGITLNAYRRHFIDLRRLDLESYMAGFSGKTRSTLRRKLRRFEEAGGGSTDFRWYRHPEQVSEFVDLAKGLSDRTYQQALFQSGLPTTTAFVSEMTDLAKQDQWRAALLLLNGSPLAYLCLPASERVLRYEWVGYDQDHADLSPGAVLQLHTLARLFEEQTFDYFDFTEGDGDHKAQFGREFMECVDIAAAKPGSSAAMWLRANRRWRSATRATTIVADRLGLKSRLKRLIRRGAGRSR